MSIQPDRTEAHTRDLARFQAIAMHAAEKAHAAIEATEDAAELCALISAVSKAGRVLRMSIALEAKLARDAARDAREVEACDRVRAERAVEARRAQIRHAVDPLIWTEHERSDAEVCGAAFEERLDHEALYPTFLDEPIAAQVERIRRAVGVTGEGTRRYVPRKLRHIPWLFDEHPGFGALDDEDDDDADDADDDVEDDAPDPPAAAPSPDPFNGRLAPPMDLPSWDRDDDTS